MVRYVIGLGLFFGQAYEEVMRQMTGTLQMDVPERLPHYSFESRDSGACSRFCREALTMPRC
jgi:hypothetical protein